MSGRLPAVWGRFFSSCAWLLWCSAAGVGRESRGVGGVASCRKFKLSYCSRARGVGGAVREGVYLLAGAGVGVGSVSYGMNFSYRERFDASFGRIGKVAPARFGRRDGEGWCR